MDEIFYSVVVPSGTTWFEELEHARQEVAELTKPQEAIIYHHRITTRKYLLDCLNGYTPLGAYEIR